MASIDLSRAVIGRAAPGGAALGRTAAGRHSHRLAGARRHLRFAPLAFVALLSACSFIPEYTRPASPVAVEWPIPPMGTGVQYDESVAAAGVGWRQFFQDPHLRELIALALEHNRDLQVALLNIEAARAQFQVQRAALGPSVGVGATGARQRTPGELSPSGSAVTSSQYQVGIALSQFEIDLFGRVRSLSQAALSQYLASEESQRNVQIVLVSQVAEAYLNLLASNAQLALTESTLKSRQESYDLVQRRYDAGVGSALDLNQAQTLLDTTRSDRQASLRARAQALNALALLTGTTALPELPTGRQGFSQNQILADIPTGLSSAVLLTRPDVLAAEHQLLAANANIGAARSAFFPTISLTGMFGTASAQLSNLFGSGSLAWSVTPQITTPIFAGGSLRGQLALAEVRKDIRVAEYERTIQQAFREVSDALAGTATYTEQIAAQSSLVAASERSRDLSQLRYDSGIDSYLQVQDAERTLFAAQQQLVQTQLQELTNRVALYKALGGGWLENTAVPAIRP